MNPPLLMVMRYSKEPFTVTTSTGKTYTVPKVGLAVRGLGPATDGAACAHPLGTPLRLQRPDQLSASPPSPHPYRRTTLWRRRPPFRTACPTCSQTPTRTSPTASCRRARRTSPSPSPTSALAAAATAAWCTRWLRRCRELRLALGAGCCNTALSNSPCLASLSPPCHLQGQNFAYLQIKTIWSVLLRSFEFELLDPVPEPNYTSMVIMPKACRVRYTRKKLVA